MDHSNIPVLKRPTKLPTREELAQIFSSKQPKTTTHATPRIIESISPPNPKTTNPNITITHNNNNTSSYNNSADIVTPYPPSSTTLNSTNIPVLNNVPSNIIPIVHHPAITSDFFTDVTTDLSDPRLYYQVNGILRKFPPPIPPPLPTTTIHDESKSKKTVSVKVEKKSKKNKKPDNDSSSLIQYESQNTSDDSTSPSDSDNPDSENDEDSDDDNESDSIEEGGVMVPFIYPPPPIVNLNHLPFSLASFKKKLDEFHNIPVPSKRGRKPKHAINEDNMYRGYTPPSALAIKNLSNEYIFMQAPPLPFPPPNYMAYPLNSDNSSLTPNDVFGLFLEANEQLPRIDMVVASAAGSLFEMRGQANKEGFDITGFEMNRVKRQKKKVKGKRRGEGDGGDGVESSESTEVSGNENEHENENEVDYYRDTQDNMDISKEENDEENSESYEDEEDDGRVDTGDFSQTSLEREHETEDEVYFSKIDTGDYYDFYALREGEQNLVDVNPIDVKFANFKPKLSNIKNKPNDKEEKETEPIEDVYEYPKQAISNLYRIDRDEFFPSSGKEVAYPNGTNRERRRISLKKSIESIEDFENRHRYDIFQIKKYQLVKRLDDLKCSKISFNDSIIYDDELRQFEQNLQMERDLSLINLKVYENYEMLKNSLDFYHHSNSIYKNLNWLLINKLEKLKNFFEFQKKMFQEYLHQSDSDLFNINSKESNKLFMGLSNRDYSTEIKEIIKNLIIEDTQQQQPVTTTTTPPQLNFDGSNINENVLIHDFMPLITPEEFNIITGDLSSTRAINPTKSTNSNNSNNNNNNTGTTASTNKKIIQSSIYEKMLTSGSDLSDSGAGTSTATTPPPKRRGGRRTTGAGTPTASNTPNASSFSHMSDSNHASTISDKNGNDYYSFSSINGGANVVGGSTGYSEANLLAKIMKQFQGPQMAKPDELIHDLESMGIQTKWPVSK